MSAKDGDGKEGEDGLSEQEVLRVMARAEAKEEDAAEASGWGDDEQEDAKADTGSLPTPKLAGSALIDKVQEYFYGDDDLARLFERFVAEHCEVVDLDSTEFKLSYTAAYDKYKALFEDKIGACRPGLKTFTAIPLL